MAKKFGFTRTIKLEWLNKTLELVKSNLSDEQIREELDIYLSFELKDKTNIGKARNILMNTWVYSDDKSVELRKNALALIDKYPDDQLAIHWSMMMNAYPVFVEICKLIGKLSEFQDEITLKQIRQKLFDEWGETSTLSFSVDKLVATLRNMNIISTLKPGLYKIQSHKIRESEVVNFMMYTMMTVDDSGYYSFHELSSTIYFFPFQYEIKKENILNDSRFTLNNFGGELTVALS